MAGLSIHELTKDNFDEKQFYMFFSDYYFENFYQISLGIDNNIFKQFLVQKIKRRILANNGYFWVINNTKKEIIATFGLEKEKKNSKYYNKNIYNISSYYNFKEEARNAFTLIKKVIEQYRKEKKIDYIKCKIDISDHKNISFLLEDNFRYYASSKKVYLNFEAYVNIPKRTKGRYKVRKYNEETDINACLELLSQHNLNEKFYNQEFPVEITQIIFNDWFKSQVKQKSSTTLVLYDVTKGNKIVGFSIHSRPEVFNSILDKNLITWDIAILDKDERGKELATILFSEIITREKADIEGSTMADNLMLQKFLHKYGFFIVGTYIFLGKKYY